MKTNAKTTEPEMKVKLSTRWVFAALNYLYCDVMTNMDHQKLPPFVAG